MSRPSIPQARGIMKGRVHFVAPDANLEGAVRFLLRKGHAGAPVVDREGVLRGVLSEHDCIAALAQAAAAGWPAGTVANHMSKEVETVSPEDDLFSLATRFAQGRHRRLVVAEEGKLVGLISRRDLLRALEAFEKRLFHKRRESTYKAIERRHRED